MEEDLLKILCCPKCGVGTLKREEDNLICTNCGAEYIIKDEIPVLLTERI